MKGESLSLIIVLILGLIISPFIIFLLWNWLMPTIFGFVKITFWQAIGLYILCSVLFKPRKNNDN